MKPVVGILCCGFDGKNQFVTDTYVRAVRISGGIPLLIPILPQDFPINSYLDICDGFLLPGGGDFTPFLFTEASVIRITPTRHSPSFNPAQ